MATARTILILTLLIFINCSIRAQSTVAFEPWSTQYGIIEPVPNVDLDNRLLTPEKDHRIQPVQAGYTKNIDFQNIAKKGVWTKLTEDTYLWRISFLVADAPALNLYLNNLQLGNNDRLFVYDPQKTTILGAFTAQNNTSFLCTQFIPGDQLIIEFNTTNKTTHLPFDIHEIGVQLASKNSRGFGGAGDCEVHVNCPEGTNWQQQRDGVARILVKQGNLTFWCTGTLVNNVRADGTPFFLTANHCGEDADFEDYAQWLFYFNYQSDNCQQPVFEPELQTISGSELLAHSVSGVSAGSDFKLLLLGTDVPSGYHPYYNGWSRSTTASPSGVTIHHPQGDVKMISTYTQPLVSSDYDSSTENPEGKYWRVYWSETQSGHGVTEGGSSGSPIFNKDGLVMGSLTGGGASCTFLDSPDYFGKFSTSWSSASGNDSTSSLQVWLDPDNTGVLSLQGSDLDTTNLTAWFTAERTSLLVGESVNFQNTSFGNISSYLWVFEGGVPDTIKQENPGPIQYPDAGTFDVKLFAYSGENADSLVRKDYIQVLPNISPNPGNGIFTLAFGTKKPENLNIEVFDDHGQKATFTMSENEDTSLTINLLSNSAGVYFVRFSSDDQQNTYKVIIIK